MAKDTAPLTVHMIGNAHIDPVWLWPLSEGRAEVLSSYRTALSLIEAYDGYVFTSGGAVTYRWVAQDAPDMLGAIRRAVAAGRWALVNGWWLQPDCNIPHGESFARHALYGQRELVDLLGERACVGYNVDSFGHAGSLPQLLRLGGLRYYVFFRPGPHEKELPATPFWWQSPDGARVLACRPPLHYCSPEDEDMRARVLAVAAETPDGVGQAMCLYGVGNHGGGPTRRNVQAILAMQAASEVVRPVFSMPQAYFCAMERSGHAWPVVQDEMQHHARGCYTALSRVKRENRHAEHALMEAERLAALATVLCGAPDQRAPLRAAWESVLENQFHDILAGTSIRDAYEDVWRSYAQAQETANQVREQAIGALSASSHVLQRAGQAVLVWNSLAWERTTVAHLALPLGGWRHDFAGRCYPGQPQIRDVDGHAVPGQLLDVVFDHNTYIAHIATAAKVPAMGCQILYVTIPEEHPPAEAPPVRPVTSLANDYHQLAFDACTGWMTSLRHQGLDRELLSGPALVPLVIDDPSDTWSHGVQAFRDECGRFVATEPPHLLHAGPVLQTIRVRSAWGSSTITTDVTLYAHQDCIDIDLQIDWREKHKMLKLAFPFRLAGATVTASCPYGCIRRQANGHEEPCQSWVDLSGTLDDEGAGVSLLNDGKYGYDALGGELRLSILRSPIYAFHDPRKVYPGVSYHYTDQGIQRVRCRLLPHRGHWHHGHPVRRSLELHAPLLPRRVEPHEGPLAAGPLLRVSPEQVALVALKLTEEHGHLIARGYETTGVAAAMEIAAPPLGRRWRQDVAPHQVWTLSLAQDHDVPTALDLLEEPLAPAR